ncbi:MAG: hypothetical protein WC141_05355 [Arcobacteraceae bacterium]
MRKSQNNNSVKSAKMDMIAARGNENKNATPTAFSKDNTIKEQVVNAKKGINLEKTKAKAKTKAKMAKASKKKAKK